MTMKVRRGMTMKKSTLLNSIELIRQDAELKEIEQGTMLKLLDLLLDYVNDKDIRDAIEGVLM